MAVRLVTGTPGTADADGYLPVTLDDASEITAVQSTTARQVVLVVDRQAVAIGGGGDPCSCCRCQRVLSWMVESSALDEDGYAHLWAVSDVACALQWENGASDHDTQPWVFVDGLFVDASWDTTYTSAETQEYPWQMVVGPLTGDGPWQVRWLVESSGLACWVFIQ